ERGLVAGALLLVLGVVLGIFAVGFWGVADFGALEPTHTMRFAIPSATCITLAFEIVYGSFVLSVLGIREKEPERAPGHIGAAQPA
ncbi:MAG TPA: hypothetical protein VFX38_01225, partial [Gammaproteobacteria bacterium]|nr:hypothetical protein [Gammaproteobacteria bacterium]